MTDYTETASGSGDWYMVPSRDKLPKVSEPYAYDIAAAGADEYAEHADHRERQVPRCSPSTFAGSVAEAPATLQPMGAGCVELLSPKGVVLASAMPPKSASLATTH